MRGIVNQFGDRYHLPNNLSERFQIFANYLFLKKEYFQINEEYLYESLLDIDLLQAINFGCNSTMAVDGCFIIHNKTIIDLTMDDEDIESKLNSFDKGCINITLIQTKSGKIDPSDLSTLSDCLNANFIDQNSWTRFVFFRNKCEILIQNYHKIQIKFKVIYVAGNIDSRMLENPTFIVREKALREAMKKYFWIHNDADVSVEYCDADYLYDEFEKQTENAQIISNTLVFNKMTDEIDCAEYGKVRFGAISIGEMMKVIWNDDKRVPNELYGYNVRDVLKDSKINKSIESTIVNQKDLFLLLNNGITMIVDKQERRGDSGIYLENIRIVNGCQTSHAILNTCRNSTQHNETKVPVKIIETRDENILGEITYSSNNQNTVSKANLFAIEPQIFKLEKSYKNFFLEYPETPLLKVDLERRQGQFSNNPNAAFIDMLAQSKSYIAIWESKPHDATMYVEQNLQAYQSKIEDELFIPKSLFAGIMWYNINTRIPANYANARYHIFYCIAAKLLEDINVNSTLINQLGLLRINIAEEVGRVCQAIDMLPDNFPKLNSGKIHYRKFYPADIFSLIYTKYSDIHATN